jgi:hypothetical protein
MKNAMTGLERDRLVGEYGWAVEIVRDWFKRGIAELFAPNFSNDRFRAFLEEQDPITFPFVSGLDNEPLARAFISYAKLFQTLTTQCRFWLDAAVAEIILYQHQRHGRTVTHLYTQGMLADGWLDVGRTIAEIGDEEKQHLADSRLWKAPVQRAALKAVNHCVDEYEENFVLTRRSPRVRVWDQEVARRLDKRDIEELQVVTTALLGPPCTSVRLHCNLLVVEPNEADQSPHAYAFRFVNPKTFNGFAKRKEERSNLLRLHAFLVQEKPFRAPVTIRTCVAELFPRGTDTSETGGYPDYFSPLTYWTSERLWGFIGVPFDVVSLGVELVARELRPVLEQGLWELLPGGDRTER